MDFSGAPVSIAAVKARFEGLEKEEQKRENW
jgi:hypothetical protein